MKFNNEIFKQVINFQIKIKYMYYKCDYEKFNRLYKRM